MTFQKYFYLSWVQLPRFRCLNKNCDAIVQNKCTSGKCKRMCSINIIYITGNRLRNCLSRHQYESSGSEYSFALFASRSIWQHWMVRFTVCANNWNVKALSMQNWSVSLHFVLEHFVWKFVLERQWKKLLLYPMPATAFIMKKILFKTNPVTGYIYMLS